MQHAGALFSCGDAHAAQGDGKVCVTGIESPMYAAFALRLDQGQEHTGTPVPAPGPLTPLVDEAGWYATMGVNEDLMQAAKDSLRAMVEHVSETYGLEPVEAYVLASLVVELKISEIVDQPNWIVSSFCLWPSSSNSPRSTSLVTPAVTIGSRYVLTGIRRKRRRSVTPYPAGYPDAVPFKRLGIGASACTKVQAENRSCARCISSLPAL